MYTIKKMRADHVIDFAAEELKKYLFMMVPECSDISIELDPEAKEGFRLGLLEDFGLPNEAKNVETDDVVHVDTTESGGILAGSNPRSVLFAVYRFLRLNGCRWLFPGVDGEFIPRKPVTAQSYHKLADHHHRGYTIEGDPSVEQVLDYIDYHAKKELNVFAPTGIHTYHRTSRPYCLQRRQLDLSGLYPQSHWHFYPCVYSAVPKPGSGKNLALRIHHRKAGLAAAGRIPLRAPRAGASGRQAFGRCPGRRSQAIYHSDRLL